MKHIVEYTVPHAHVVHVGIEADTAEQAIEKARQLFDDGSIWDNTESVPLLYDDFDEVDTGEGLQFRVDHSLGATEDYPEPSDWIKQQEKESTAKKAVATFIAAYQKGKKECDWSDMEQAYTTALRSTL